MKNVLLSAYACIPDRGSEEGNGWYYSSLISQQGGYRVWCLTRPVGEEEITRKLREVPHPNLRFEYVRLPGWVEKAYDRGLLGLYFHYLYWQWSAYRVGRRLDHLHRFDLIHHVTYGSIQLGSFLYKLRKPFIFGPLGGGQRAPQALRRYFGRYWSREWLRDQVSTLLQHLNPGFYEAVKWADRLVVTNQATFDLARQLRPDRPIDRIRDAGLGASFMPTGPVEHRAGPTLKLLWVGRLLPRKALELTIHALSKVSPAVPVSLTIVGGKGEMAGAVPGYIERYGVADRVSWIGHVSYQEVRDYYQQSDVFFFTSLRDSCPHQLLEAMAFSLPIVTLDLHGQAELVSESSGIRVPVTDEEGVTTDLALALEWMYHHPDERQAMGRAGYEFALTQVWDAKIRLFLDDLYPATLPVARRDEPVVASTDPCQRPHPAARLNTALPESIGLAPPTIPRGFSSPPTTHPRLKGHHRQP